MDALEAFQLFHGAGNAAHQVADIELYDFICIVVTRIGYGYGSGQLAVRIQLLGAERDVTVLEGGVAQAIAERIQRVVAHIQVVAAELLEPFAFFQRTAGILVVVCHRQLAHILRESGGQLTAGANVSEHYVGNGVCSFTTSEPYIQDGGNIFILPSQHYGTSGEQYQYYGFARFQQCFQQVALCVRHFQFGTATALTTHLGGLAEGGYNDIGLCGYFQGFVQQFLVRTVVPVQGTSEHGGALFVGGITDEVAAFGVCDVHFAGHHLLQSFIQRGVVVEACGYAPCSGHIAACIAQRAYDGHGSFFFQRKQRFGQRARMLLDAAVL